MSYPQYVFQFYIHLRHIRPDRKTQIVNCRQNKTHSRKQVLKYANLVKSRSKPPWTPYQGFALDPLGALSGHLTPRRNYAYTSICSSYAPDYDLQNITQKSKDRATRNTLKFGSKLGYFGRVTSSCSTCGTRRVTLVTNLVVSHEWGKNRIVITTRFTCVGSNDTFIHWKLHNMFGLCELKAHF